MENLDQMEAGVELDLAIVRALDEPDSAEPLTPFQPSRDWNDAMAAAEKIGLFGTGSHDLAILHKTSDGWAVRSMPFLQQPLQGFNDNLLAAHESGPVAICRAILTIRCNR